MRLLSAEPPRLSHLWPGRGNTLTQLNSEPSVDFGLRLTQIPAFLWPSCASRGTTPPHCSCIPASARLAWGMQDNPSPMKTWETIPSVLFQGFKHVIGTVGEHTALQLFRAPACLGCQRLTQDVAIAPRDSFEDSSMSCTSFLVGSGNPSVCSCACCNSCCNRAHPNH